MANEDGTIVGELECSPHNIGFEVALAPGNRISITCQGDYDTCDVNDLIIALRRAVNLHRPRRNETKERELRELISGDE